MSDPSVVARMESELGFNEDGTLGRSVNGVLPRRVPEWRPVATVRLSHFGLAYEAFHVYVVYAKDAPDAVLYVGRSNQILGRLNNHLKRAPWRDEIGDVEVHEFATARDMADGEALLVDLLEPRYNVARPEFIDGEFQSWKRRSARP